MASWMCYLMWGEIINVRLGLARRLCELRKEHQNRIAQVSINVLNGEHGRMPDFVWPVSNNPNPLRIRKCWNCWLREDIGQQAEHTPKILNNFRYQFAGLHFAFYTHIRDENSARAYALVHSFANWAVHITHTELCLKFLLNFTLTYPFIETATWVVRLTI